MSYKEQQIARGEKWAKVLAKAIFEKRDKNAEWLNDNENIQVDIKAYEESLNPSKETKSKGKK